MSTIEINDTIELSELAGLVGRAFEVIDNSGEYDNEDYESAIEDLEIVGDVLAQFGLKRDDSRKFEAQLAELENHLGSTVFVEENYFEEQVVGKLLEVGISEESDTPWFTESGALDVTFAKAQYRNVDIDGNSYYIGK